MHRSPDNDRSARLNSTDSGTVAFAHDSERVAAEILEFYNVRWEYEPRSFPIQWDASGKPISYFTPDFYLPDFDLFIELTTMSQKLVTKKNRKVRRINELYPEINIKIFYQRDFRALLGRFGVTSTPQPHAAGGGFISPPPTPHEVDD